MDVLTNYVTLIWLLTNVMLVTYHNWFGLMTIVRVPSMDVLTNYVTLIWLLTNVMVVTYYN